MSNDSRIYLFMNVLFACLFINSFMYLFIGSSSERHYFAARRFDARWCFVCWCVHSFSPSSVQVLSFSRRWVQRETAVKVKDDRRYIFIGLHCCSLLFPLCCLRAGCSNSLSDTVWNGWNERKEVTFWCFKPVFHGQMFQHLDVNLQALQPALLSSFQMYQSQALDHFLLSAMTTCCCMFPAA